MGVASGWNLWVWLQCIGVASRCCYKEVQWNLYIAVTPRKQPSGCYIQVACL